jgi:hypothetical protein
VGFDPSAIQALMDVREKKAKPSQLRGMDVVASYLSIIEQVNAAVDKMLDAGVSGQG